ncbi:MAG: lysylphosphatidylglycerol synthase transmembrane domain-containing protein [Deltaproteobacteria bacterium]
MKNILSVLLKVCVSGFILYVLFSKIDMALFWRTAISVKPYVIVLIALFFVCTQAVSTYRWSIVLKKDMEVKYFKLLSIYFIGMFFNNFLPTMVGGDLVKGYFLYRYSQRGDVSFASMFMDRYSGFTALMVLTALSLIPGYALIKGTPLPIFLALLIGAFVMASLVIWVGSLHTWVMALLSMVRFFGINKKIDAFYNVLMSYKKHRGLLVKIFLCSLFVQSGVIIGYYLLGVQLGINISIGYYFLLIPLTTVISMLPLSLAGLGIREGAFIFLFPMVGATKEQAVTLSLMWFAITAIVSIIGGVEYIRMGGMPSAITPLPKGER